MHQRIRSIYESLHLGSDTTAVNRCREKHAVAGFHFIHYRSKIIINFADTILITFIAINTRPDSEFLQNNFFHRGTSAYGALGNFRVRKWVFPLILGDPTMLSIFMALLHRHWSSPALPHEKFLDFSPLFASRKASRDPSAKTEFDWDYLPSMGPGLHYLGFLPAYRLQAQFGFSEPMRPLWIACLMAVPNFSFASWVRISRILLFLNTSPPRLPFGTISTSAFKVMALRIKCCTFDWNSLISLTSGSYSTLIETVSFPVSSLLTTTKNSPVQPFVRQLPSRHYSDGVGSL